MLQLKLMSSKKSHYAVIWINKRTILKMRPNKRPTLRLGLLT